MRIVCIIFALLFLSSCTSVPVETADKYNLTLRSNFSDWHRIPSYDRDIALRGAITKYMVEKKFRTDYRAISAHLSMLDTHFLRIRDCLYELSPSATSTVLDALKLCRDDKVYIRG